MQETTFIEGQTTELFVSRLNIYEDGMDEIISEIESCDRSLPLEVTFTGEKARDYGGPRREFISLMLREIKERLFVENNEGGEGGYFLKDILTARISKYYIGAGIIFGKFWYVRTVVIIDSPCGLEKKSVLYNTMLNYRHLFRNCLVDVPRGDGVCVYNL